MKPMWIKCAYSGRNGWKCRSRVLVSSLTEMRELFHRKGWIVLNDEYRCPRHTKGGKTPKHGFLVRWFNRGGK